MPKQKRAQSKTDDNKPKIHHRTKGDADARSSSKLQMFHRTNHKILKSNECEASTKESSDGIVNQVDPFVSGHPKSVHTVSSPSLIRQALLKWYATVNTNRGMPWRKPYNSDLGIQERAQRAYEVWVRFPTVAHLADSTVDEVNALWKGLGYYSRASRLLTAAQIVVRDYQGRLPDNAKTMEANIPGIGRYSAGAICSIAYGERVPVLDGNVHRLFSRFLALHAPPKSKATLDTLWAAATVMVEHEDDNVNHPGDVNQALIELGSTVCKIRDPTCGDCPLNAWCSAYNRIRKPLPDIEGLCTLCEPLTEEQSGVTAFPMKARKKKAREELDVVSVIEWRLVNDRRFLLVRRPDKGLLAGLYEFPATCMDSVPISNVSGPNVAQQQLLDVLEDSVAPFNEKPTRIFQRDYSVDSEYHIINVTPMGDVPHTFSHIQKTYRVQWVVIKGGSKPPQLKCGPELDREERHTSQNAFWASVSQVMNANIGTGVSKVWKLVLTTWEKESIRSI
ncbi:DNA glycosylase [Lentinula aciculospora]|uniref:Adenine DNA glycosylase n=1 Tax=Lentinula aciculospora TaxID=153920 RepID=A0A9W8ZWG5_9AGAR|nr:DNA glycosylase [Lentinula aciculospora]